MGELRGRVRSMTMEVDPAASGSAGAGTVVVQTDNGLEVTATVPMGDVPHVRMAQWNVFRDAAERGYEVTGLTDAFGAVRWVAVAPIVVVPVHRMGGLPIVEGLHGTGTPPGQAQPQHQQAGSANGGTVLPAGVRIAAGGLRTGDLMAGPRAGVGSPLSSPLDTRQGDRQQYRYDDLPDGDDL